jgi:hypothetical protein
MKDDDLYNRDPMVVVQELLRRFIPSFPPITKEGTSRIEEIQERRASFRLIKGGKKDETS